MSARIKNNAAQQGQLDGACGFYAITNAIHILEPDLQPEEIFRITWHSFLEDGNPMAIIDGTSRGNLKNVLSRTINKINRDYILTSNDDLQYEFRFQIPYWSDQKPRDRTCVIQELCKADHKNDCVIIMGYEFSKDELNPTYNHWTVIREVANEHLITHDSSGEKNKVHLSEIRVDSFAQKKHTARPYNIFSRDIFIIEKVLL